MNSVAQPATWILAMHRRLVMAARLVAVMLAAAVFATPAAVARDSERTQTDIAASASGYTYSVLYSFCPAAGCADGEYPEAGLIQDAAGNLYGTTYAGGEANSKCAFGTCGTVFKLSTTGQETVLYSFCSASNCTDGNQPQSVLVRDTAGNIYGTTAYGGAGVVANGGGTVFKVDSTGHETVLYSFCPVSGCDDGYYIVSGLIQDTSGNLYGTPGFGGAKGHGAVFKVDNSDNETTLYSFCSVADCTDGSGPYGGVIADAAGNLYGTTTGGGANCVSDGGCGTVFKVDATGHESVLYSFCSVGGTSCTDGAYPYVGLIRDAAGNLYGTTAQGGTPGCYLGCGTVFKVDMTGKETVLYSFCSASGCADGATPYAGLIQDAAGNLYGTTDAGGAVGKGTVFEVDPSGNETVLHSFCSVGYPSCTDGQYTFASLIQDAAGNFYGTTQKGGANGYGTVFKLLPAGGSSRFTTFDATGAGQGENQGTIATSINTLGTIAGFYIDSSYVNHGFVRATDGAITGFEAPDAGAGAKQGTKAYGINTAGTIVGTYHDSGGVWHSFERVASGAITEFSASQAGTAAGQGTFAFGINTAKVISGLYVDANSMLHGFVRDSNGALTPFDVLGAGTGAGQGTAGISINTAGEIAGYYIDTNNVAHGFERSPSGIITPFDVMGAGTGAGQGTGGGFATSLNFEIGINTAGIITGYYVDSSNGYHGFARAANGTISEIDAPCAGTAATQGTIPSGINTAGTVTGYCVDSGGVGHGFVRPPAGGTIADFDAPGAGTDEGAGTVAYAINTGGTITGTYVDESYVFHGYALVPPTPTATTLSSSLNPSIYGEATTFAVTVTSTVGAPPDGDTVSFMKGKTVLATATLSGGSASFIDSILAVGTNSITAVYAGDPNFTTSTSKPVSQVVTKATSTTTLTSSLNPSTVGQSVTFTASVTPQFAVAPTGTVSFYDGATLLKTSPLSAGQAGYTTTKLAAGAHTIKATYDGSASFDASSATLTQTVN